MDSIQSTPLGVPGLVYPTSGVGVSVLNAMFKLEGSKVIRSITRRLGSKQKKAPIELPAMDGLTKV